MGIQFLALLTSVHAKIELAKQIMEYLKLFPQWQKNVKEQDEKVKTLKRKRDALIDLAGDVNEEVKAAEIQPGKKPRREVETWLKNVETKKDDIRKLEEKVGEKKYLLFSWLESSVERNLQEVKELYEQGQFSDGLFLDVRSTSGEPLLTQKLVGRDSNLKTIFEWLNDSSVSRIGVYGERGVGKTAILTHIQNGLTQNNTTFEHVYWVGVPEQPSVQKLQGVIARQVGLNLSDEEDKIIRASKLHNALTRTGNCVIILDGVGRLSTEEVGIPDGEKGCKMVLSTGSLRHCLRMNCEKTLEIEPLSHDEASTLFRQKLANRNTLGQEIENIVEQIVKECQGLPLWIMNVADRLRGVDDINEWRNALTEVTEYRKGLAD
ncbi:putative disease resistance protein [Morus notabilis]|uniref:Putative disease resistance protein n=1 Tax=Morus notabilis TaxID=981085 RepID=W9QHT4_9ROSA|nr:disease resistance protein SUMM2 [Morus notabilis]EXB37727.1 putative disease resistance protein [Morus notabilis]